MKRLFLMALILSLGAALITYNAKTNGDALAEADNMTVTVECTSPAETAFVPETIAWTIEASDWAAQTAAAPNGPNGLLTEADIAGVVSGGVNGDTALTPDGEDIAGIAAGYVIFYSKLPAIKLTGLQCETKNTASVVAIASDTDTNLDLAVGDVGTPGFSTAIRIDSATSQNVIGDGFEITAVPDGTDDDESENGEIVYGGSDENRGRLYMKLDFSGNTTTGSQTSTITFTSSNI